MTDRTVWIDRGWMPVYICFCPDKESWKKLLKKIKVPKEPYPTAHARATGFSNCKYGSVYILTMQDGCEEEREVEHVVSLIVHEATHIWRWIKEEIGEKEPSLEFEAYAMQGITQGLLTAFKETRGSLGK